MSSTYRALVKILKKHDCTFLRQGRGDHEWWHSPITDRKFQVDKGVKKPGTANAYLKNAGITEKMK